MLDVRMYLSAFWRLLLMLIKLPHYLSDVRLPLVGVLGPIFCFKNEGFWRELKSWKFKENIAKMT